jgi:hypothetical protein
MTSPGFGRRSGPSREAFVKLALRHYDRMPGAGLKGGARHPKLPIGQRRVEQGGRRSVTRATSPHAETGSPAHLARSARTEVLRHRGGRSAERPLPPEQSGKQAFNERPPPPRFCREGRNEEGRVNDPERTPLAGTEKACLMDATASPHPLPSSPRTQ